MCFMRARACGDMLALLLLLLLCAQVGAATVASLWMC
jgi:hypothetical protein